MFFVFTGTAANVPGLGLLPRPSEAVICAESANLNADECGGAGAGSGCQAADGGDTGPEADTGQKA